MPITVFTSAKRAPPEIDGKYWIALAQEHFVAGKPTEAIAALARAAAVTPLDPEIYRLQALAFDADGQKSEALAAGLAVSALESGSAAALFNIGLPYFLNRHFPPAAHWFRLALLINPDMVPANQNLASMLQREGKTKEADYHYDRAYTRQSLFITPAETPVRNVLILCSSRPGNVPYTFLLPQSNNTLIEWVIEYAVEEQALPNYDLVFNAIGDADIASRSQARVDRFMAVNDKPVLNPPHIVARTSRDQIGGLLAGIEGIHVPAVVRWNRRDAGVDTLHAHIATLAATATALTYPVIVRPAGAHGGDGVVLLQGPQADAAPIDVESAVNAPTDTPPDAPADIPAPLLPDADELYLSSYCEYRSEDGFFRKYRVIFVDRVPYPYHLAISGQWLTHYVTADMLSLTSKTYEEYCFMKNPVAVLGTAAWAALEAIAQRLDLDFCGVDFSVLPDGRLLIFEANATMLVHPETYHAQLKYKNWYIQHIYDAFDRMLDHRMGLPTYE